MELDLDVVDYLQVSVTGKNCMRVLPHADKKRSSQKVIVGDQKGTLQCFGIKRRDINSVFKTLPGAPINKVVLGGALGTPQDKIFVAANTEVRGYSRKGKKFLDFNTNLTEFITNLSVSGSDLLAGGSYLYNHFNDCIDQGYYFSPDKINDSICVPASRREKDKFTSVLACNDRLLRLLDGCELQHEIQVSSIPMSISEYTDPTSTNEENINLVYGMEDGNIGHVVIEDGNPTFKWEIPNTTNLGGVSCMNHFDITGDGVKDLIVGREDGTIQVFSYDAMDEPLLRFTHCFNESVTAVDGGAVGSSANEIVASTYSGWVSGLTTEQVYRNVSSITAASTVVRNETSELAVESQVSVIPLFNDDDMQKKVDNLRSEVENLQMKVAMERDKYAEKLSKPKTNEVAMTSAGNLHVNDRFVLSPTDASYHLSVEVQTAIEHVVLQSNVPIDILDAEKTTAVISYTSNTSQDAGAGDVANENFILVTYRCQANTTRLEVKIRSIEGHHGHIQAYIVPRLHPKSCVLRRYPIKPLSLHQRAHEIDEQRPTSMLKLTGSFSIAEVHSWLTTSLPEVPERVPTEDQACLSYVSTFLGTQLKCTYKKGEVVFHSDNISTISILKDFMSKEATRKKITLNIQYEFSGESIIHTLHLLHPKLEQQLMLAKKVQLLGALEELATNEGDTDFLAPEYKDILTNAETIKADFAKQPSHLERLYGMLTDLYIDKHKFKGINVKHRVPLLLQILDNYQLPSLIQFFQQSATS